MPEVSVLMPCYNATPTLQEALRSLEEQTMDDFEIIAVDDGSLDDTRQILQNWAQRDQRLKVVHQKHAGIIQALNIGLVHCRAPLVARMDADDHLHPRRLEEQQMFLQANPQVDLVGCLVEAFPEKQVREGFRIYLQWLNSLVSEMDIRREIFVESPFAHPSVMFRKATVERLGGYQDHGWAEDYDLWLRMFLNGARFAKLPQVLVFWREHIHRLTRQDSRYSLENFLRAKAFYLRRGPLAGCRNVIIWGAGMTGRRLSKHLQREGVPLKAFIDVDEAKIGRTRRGLPIYAPSEIPDLLGQFPESVILAAVGARGARKLIRTFLLEMGLVEGKNWWAVA